MTRATFASDFVEALTGEIETYSAALPEAVTGYRGANLRYAVERALYFRYANDSECQDFIRTSLPDPGWMARSLHRGRLRAGISALGRALKDAVPGLSTRRRSHSRASSLAFAVVHPKFVRYAEAIGYSRDVSTIYRSPLHYRQPLRRVFDARQPILQILGLRRELDAALDFLTRTRPRIVVVIEGNAPFDEVMNQACKLLDVPCICIQQGWSPIVHSGFRNLSFDRMLMWGKGFEDLLSPCSPRQRFIATGSHIVGPPEYVAPSASRDAISFFLQGVSPIISAAALDGFVNTLRAVAGNVPNTPILVREHPSSPLDARTRELLAGHANIQCLDPAHISLEQQLARSRIAVSLFSTTLFEAAANGVVPIVVNPGILREFVPSLVAEGVGVEAPNWADAHELVVRLYNDVRCCERYLARRPEYVSRFFNSATREQAAAAIRDQLAHFVR